MSEATTLTTTDEPTQIPATSETLSIYDRAKELARGAYLPLHLQGKVTKGGTVSEFFKPEQIVANCVQIVAISDRWEMNPFAVAGESYSVHGRLGFQGKLIAAVINAHCGLSSGLEVIHAGGEEQVRRDLVLLGKVTVGGQ